MTLTRRGTGVLAACLLVAAAAAPALALDASAGTTSSPPTTVTTSTAPSGTTGTTATTTADATVASQPKETPVASSSTAVESPDLSDTTVQVGPVEETVKQIEATVQEAETAVGQEVFGEDPQGPQETTGNPAPDEGSQETSEGAASPSPAPGGDQAAPEGAPQPSPAAPAPLTPPPAAGPVAHTPAPTVAPAPAVERPLAVAETVASPSSILGPEIRRELSTADVPSPSALLGEWDWDYESVQSPRSTAPLMAMVPGIAGDDLARLLAPFPVAGAANYSDDWGAPRYDPTPHPHVGTDIFAARGTPVVASTSGTISRLRPDTMIGGNSLRLTAADGTFFYYAHLDAFAEGLSNGDTVALGQVLGFVGDTGNAKGTPPHLHYQIHPGGGDPVSPVPHLDRWLAQAMQTAQQFSVGTGLAAPSPTLGLSFGPSAAATQSTNPPHSGFAAPIQTAIARAGTAGPEPTLLLLSFSLMGWLVAGPRRRPRLVSPGVVRSL